MVNFKVIDGDDSFYTKADTFIRLYTDKKYTIESICSELNLTVNQYNRLRDYCAEFKGLSVKNKIGKFKKCNGSVSLPKYYSRTMFGTFQVRKTVNGKVIAYGVYKTPEIADAIVERLIECDWDKNELERIRKEVLG